MIGFLVSKEKVERQTTAWKFSEECRVSLPENKFDRKTLQELNELQIIVLDSSKIGSFLNLYRLPTELF